MNTTKSVVGAENYLKVVFNRTIMNFRPSATTMKLQPERAPNALAARQFGKWHEVDFSGKPANSEAPALALPAQDLKTLASKAANRETKGDSETVPAAEAAHPGSNPISNSWNWEGIPDYIHTKIAGVRFWVRLIPHNKWYKTMKHVKKRLSEYIIQHGVERIRNASEHVIAKGADSGIKMAEHADSFSNAEHHHHAHAHHHSHHHEGPKSVMEYEKHFNVGAATVHIGGGHSHRKDEHKETHHPSGNHSHNEKHGKAA